MNRALIYEVSTEILCEPLPRTPDACLVEIEKRRHLIRCLVNGVVLKPRKVD